CENSPRMVFELVPLRQKIIATMIADLFNDLSVSDGNLSDVRRVDDEFAAVRNDGFEFIHALACDPQIIIHLRHVREHGLERLVLVNDMNLSRYFARAIPRGFRRTEGKTAK